jgi:hypothetical protein
MVSLLACSTAIFPLSGISLQETVNKDVEVVKGLLVLITHSFSIA